MKDYIYTNEQYGSIVVATRSRYGHGPDFNWNLPCKASEAFQCVEEAIEKTGMVYRTKEMRYNNVSIGIGQVYCYPGIKVTWAEDQKLNNDFIKLLNWNGIPANGVILQCIGFSCGARRGDSDIFLVGWTE